MLNIQERIDVTLVNSLPKWIFWNGRTYKISKVGLHHSYYEGKSLYHIFSVISGNLFLRLKLKSENLTWILESIQEVNN